MPSGSPTVRPLGRARSLLFAPAVRPDFIGKLPSRGADLVVIDCEDATPANAKAAARATARASAPGLVVAGCQVSVRVNSPATEWFEDDVVEALGPGLASVVVPKIESVTMLDRVADRLDDAGLHDLGVMVGVETALGVADARELLAHPRVVGAYFGAEDLVADMGGVRTSSNDEVSWARSWVAVAARLAGVPVLDMVVADFRDDDRFEREASQARALGYAGKMCVHPGQVALANRAFVPSAADVERARRLLAAYEAASDRGVAAIDFEGQMVDEPLAAQARRVLSLADPDAGT